MNLGKYTLVNGTFVLSDEYFISGSDSKCLVFTEKVRAVRSFMPFFNEKLELIIYKLELFNQSFPEFTDKNGTELKRQIERTLTKNKHFLGAVIYLTFRFKDEKTNYTIQSEKLDETAYELNEKGLYISLFDEIQKPVSAISNLSIGSELFWNIAKSQHKNQPADRILILSTRNEILEVPESNIYTIKGNSVYSPNISSGAFMDITQPFMLYIFKKLNLEFSDEEPLSVQHIQEADEVFIVNSIEGVNWIVGFEGKRFFNNTIRRISEEFSKCLIQ